MHDAGRLARRPIIAASVADRSADAFVTPLETVARFSLRLAFDQAVKLGTAGGMTLDTPINTCRAAGGRLSARLGPDEWLLIGTDAQSSNLELEISAGLGSTFFSLVDIGHRDIAIAVGGPHAAEIINGGCALDLDDASFPAGTATRTLFGKAGIVLIRAGVDRAYRVECARSFAPYIFGLLKEIAREFTA